ncbi:MAG: FtsB family cell division protein [Thermoleophilia bacterium]
MSSRATASPGMIGFLSRRRGWWRLVVLGIILLIMGSYVSPVKAYLEKSSAIQREQAVTDDLRLQHDELEQEKINLQNTGYVEQVARKDLGMVKPGEQPYVVKDLNDGAPPAADVPQPQNPSLFERVVNSVSSLLP